jgi:uncharacterized repeat protein (TIGR01451 family)
MSKRHSLHRTELFMKKTGSKIFFRPTLYLLALLFTYPLFAQDGAGKKVKAGYGSAWHKEQSNSPLSTFNSWATRYAGASAKSKSDMLSEGQQLAEKRRNVMEHLARVNPEAAIAESVPESVRRHLPKSIQSKLETRVSGVGDLTVLGYLAAKGGPAVQPVKRFVKLNGKTYEASVYGRRAFETSKKGIPLNGVVVNGILVLEENSIRPLEDGEVAPQDVIDLRSAGQKSNSQSSIIGEVGGKYYRFDSQEDMDAAEAKLNAAEAAISPYPTQSADDLLQSTSTASRGTSGNPPSAWTTGQKKVLVIRVDFPDLPGDPVGFNDTTPISGYTTYTADYVQGIADNRIAPYYFRSSYGLTTLSNVVATTVYRMPQTSTNYATTITGNDQLHADAEAAAAADFTLTDFDRVVVLFSFLGNIPNSFINYGGLAEIVGKRVWCNGEFDFRVVAHELGHTYGLYHAGLWAVNDGDPISPNGSVIEYGDDFDTMGANFANDPNTDFNPFYKNMLGWLPDSEVQTAATNGVYRVYAFDWNNYQQATNNPILALKFVKDSERTYWIGVRRNFTDNSLMQTGAYVMWGFNTPGGGSGGGFQSAVLDLNTPGLAPSGGVNSDFDAALGLNSVFSDSSVNFRITPAAGDNSTANAYVDFVLGDGGFLQIETNIVTGGNGNGLIDFDECNNLEIVLRNSGTTATNVSATLLTTTPEVIIAQPFSFYPSIPNGTNASNITPFKVSTSPSFACGTPIEFALVVKADANTHTNFFTVSTGVLGAPVQFSNNNTYPIPDSNALGVDSPIVVSNFNSTIGKVTVAVYLTHTFDFDLQLQLIAPDGTTVALSRNNGGSGDNYGAGCSPDGLRTHFDDAALTPIEAGTAPFVGTFKPTEALSAFNLRSGTNVNGIWKLHVVDQLAIDTGAIQCWSLNLSPQMCTDGGGECPGSDLGISMTAAPAPAVIGGNLTYTINVTNFGPSSAKSVVLSQVLPSGVTFLSATNSQGNIQQAGGVVTCNFGKISAHGSATATVVVIPTIAGTITSTATVSSEQADSNTANNNVTVATSVVPPSADLAVTMSDSPDPAGVGSVLTYTVNVLNRGPVPATNVKLTNNLPITAAFVSATSSQGTFVNSGGTIIYSLGTLTNGGSAVVTIKVRPTTIGTISATSLIGSDESDLLPGNNVATAVTTVTPSADLALTLAANPQSVVVGSNITFSIAVTNRGPSAATGVTISGTLPGALVTNILSQGTFNINGGTFSATIGSLPSGASANLTIVITAPQAPQTVTMSASVSGSEGDPNLTNNTASASVSVATPFTSIIPAGSRLTAESFSPANGVVDSGETVSVALSLRNGGNVNTTNVTATLLSGNGVTSPSGSQTYGSLIASGEAVARTFSFTAAATNGQTITAVLRVQDGTGPATNVNFTFTLPSSATFVNTNGINIPDVGTASPYPSQIVVSNLSGLVTKVTATLKNINHTYPDDVDVLLVDPTGRKAILMSGSGGGNPLSNVTLTFDSDAATFISDTDQLVSGAFKPAAYFPNPVFTNAPAGPYDALLQPFDGTSPNGTWSLYVVDHQGGDAGNIANGWSLTITTAAHPVNQVSDLSITSLSAPVSVMTGQAAAYVFAVTNNGPDTASGVVLNNVLPAGAEFVSSSLAFSQVGSTVTCNLGDLAPGTSVTITNTIRPMIAQVLTNSAVVSATETDFNPANNSVVVLTGASLPVADVGVSQTATSPAVTGHDLVYTLLITNAGPDTANNVIVTDKLPASASYVSATSSQGTSSVSNGIVTIQVGNFGPGNSALISITVTPNAIGSITNLATVTTASNDSNQSNNSSSNTTVVSNPFPIIVSSGASLVSEGSLTNGSIDPGETVTMSFALENHGTANTANLVATLQTSGGVTAPSSPQNYGVIVSGGAAVSRNFTFTASPGSTGNVTATLLIQDGASNLGSVVYTFELPTRHSFTNSSAISIPNSGPATPYPSTISVSGVSGIVSKVNVSIKGLSHAFPDDVRLLLVGPSGQKVLLMTDAGGGHAVSEVNLAFDDSGALLPDSGQIVSGTYRCSDFGSGAALPPPAPSIPYSASLAALNGGDANGIWSLYVSDDSVGDSGIISGGWTLAITTVNPINPAANLSISVADAPRPAFVGVDLTYTVVISNQGPSTATGVTLTDMLPLGANTASAAKPSGIPASQQIIYNLGNLGPNETLTTNIVIVPGIVGSAVNVATVTANEVDLYTGDNTVQTSTPVIATQPPSLGSAEILTNGDFQLMINGQAGTSYIIEVSSNLTSWIPVSTNTAAENGTCKFVDSSTSSFNPRFYRALLLP